MWMRVSAERHQKLSVGQTVDLIVHMIERISFARLFFAIEIFGKQVKSPATL